MDLPGGLRMISKQPVCALCAHTLYGVSYMEAAMRRAGARWGCGWCH